MPLTAIAVPPLPTCAGQGVRCAPARGTAAGALERIVGAAADQGLDRLRRFDQAGVVAAGQVGVGGAEGRGEREARRIDVDGDDHARAGVHGALDAAQAHPARAQHHHARARLDLGRIGHRAEAGHDAAAQNGGGRKGDVDLNLHNRLPGHQRVGRHGPEPEAWPDPSPGPTETLIGHLRLGLAQALRAAPALKALAAGDGPVQQDRIAHRDMADALAGGRDHARALVPEDQRPGPAQTVEIGVADPARPDRHQHFAGARIAEVELGVVEAALAVGDNRPGLHRHVPSRAPCRNSPR